MASITYFVREKNKNDGFEFELRVFDTSRWEIAASRGLGRWEPLLRPPGTWNFRKDGRRRGGYLFFHLDGSRSDPFVIALDEVPDDFLHGTFCSVDSGKGTLSPSVKDDIPIVWAVRGAGCV